MFSQTDDKVYSDLIDELAAMIECDDLNSLLRGVMDRYGLCHASYIAYGTPYATAENPLFNVTYPAPWISRYVSQNYVLHDPVIYNGMRALLPVDWDTVRDESPVARQIMGEAAEYGVGRRGLSIPIRGQSGERALFSLTSNEAPAQWRSATKFLMRDFQMIAFHVHRLVLIREGVTNPLEKLSAQEMKCLTWAARGKTAIEIGDILNINTRTVRYYMETARSRLGTLNVVHSVARAIRLGLIPAPD